MTRLGDALDGWVEDPALRQRHRFTRGTDPDGSEVLHVETWIAPGGGVPPHVHPAMEERFHVLQGRPSFLAGRTWREAAPGEEVVVPAHTRCDVRPPSSLQQFLEETAALSRDGHLTASGMIKPSGLVRAAMIA